MTTKAKAAKGTLVQKGDGATPTEVFATIGEVVSFSGPSVEAETIEVTSFDSTAKEFISSGLPDFGELSMSMNFVGSDEMQQALRDDQLSGEVGNYKIVYNDHATTKSTLTFPAIVQSIDGPSAGGPAEAYKMDVTLKFAGPGTWSFAPA